MRAPAPFAALVALTACIHRPPPVRLAEPTPIAFATVIDRTNEILRSRLEGAPEELLPRMQDTLDDRNLVVKPFASEKVEAARETVQRLRELSAGASAKLLLLAEIKVVFYELLQGRYKWTVYSKFTVARKDDLAGASSAEIEVPVFLLYDHEREVEALREAAPSLAERAGQLVDDFLRGESKRTQAAHVGPRGPIYFVMVDRFANGDVKNDADANPADPIAFHGGDLQGVIDRLDWLQSLGVETVWLSPVFQMRTAPFMGHAAFHGYWVEDLSRIEPRFGDAALLRKLGDALHARGMKLVLDVVLNHVAMDAPLTRTHPDWFHNLGPIDDWNDAAQLETHDVHGLPDLAQEREDVYRYLLDASLNWIDQSRADGFRLDAVKHVPLAFWKRFAADVRAHAGPHFWLLGEALDGEPAKLAALLAENAFDAVFDFPLAFALTDVYCRGQPIGRLAATLSLDRLYRDPAHQLVTLLDNHDLPRLMSACGGDVARVRRALDALFALRGTISLQYGTEVGLRGEKEPDNRGDMRFEPGELREHVQRLARQRRERPSLQEGETRIVSFDGGELVLARGDDTIVRMRSDLVEIKGERVEQPARRGSRAIVLTSEGAPGEAFVVGAGPELGSWDPRRALGPIGAQLNLSLPRGAVYQFKLVVKRPGGQVTWERGGDRYLFVDDGDAPVRVAAKWRGA